MKLLSFNELQQVSGGITPVGQGRDYITDDGRYMKYVRDGFQDTFWENVMCLFSSKTPVYTDYWIEVDPQTMEQITYSIDANAKKLIRVK